MQQRDEQQQQQKQGNNPCHTEDRPYRRRRHRLLQDVHIAFPRRLAVFFPFHQVNARSRSAAPYSPASRREDHAVPEDPARRGVFFPRAEKITFFHVLEDPARSALVFPAPPASFASSLVAPRRSRSSRRTALPRGVDRPYRRGEQIFRRAIQEQGRGRVLDTLQEIQERHDTVKEIERKLLDLQQIFLDLAVLVEAQGEMVDNIETQVTGALEHSVIRRIGAGGPVSSRTSTGESPWQASSTCPVSSIRVFACRNSTDRRPPRRR
ncbi:uncharacterized protein [Miscanthus floridulus]|uniref:uncharacterized protein n=1 Tax=Miscanthus floridulus TaxID=154761 RepID=UPI003458A6FE